VNVYPFIEAEKQYSHTHQDGQHGSQDGHGRVRGNVKRACELLMVSTSAFYAYLLIQAAGGTARQRQDVDLSEKIAQVHEESKGVYGAPRVHAQLAAAGHRHGRKRVARLMRENDLYGRTRRRWRKTTIPDPSAPGRQDLIGRDFTVDPTKINTRWCGDISYIRTESGPQGWTYLATVIDIASRRVVGWAAADHMRTDLIEHALRDAVTSRRPGPGVIFHSDYAEPSVKPRDRVLACAAGVA
jgi:transposase InsO family protein